MVEQYSTPIYIDPDEWLSPSPSNDEEKKDNKQDVGTENE